MAIPLALLVAVAVVALPECASADQTPSTLVQRPWETSATLIDMSADGVGCPAGYQSADVTGPPEIASLTVCNVGTQHMFVANNSSAVALIIPNQRVSTRYGFEPPDLSEWGSTIDEAVAGILNDNNLVEPPPGIYVLGPDQYVSINTEPSLRPSLLSIGLQMDMARSAMTWFAIGALNLMAERSEAFVTNSQVASIKQCAEGVGSEFQSVRSTSFTSEGWESFIGESLPNVPTCRKAYLSFRADGATTEVKKFNLRNIGAEATDGPIDDAFEYLGEVFDHFRP